MTAREMLAKVKANGYGRDRWFSFAVPRAHRCFMVIEKLLSPEDKVLLPFLGTYQLDNEPRQTVCAFAITKDKIIFGKAKAFGEIFSKQVSLDTIISIQSRKISLRSSLIFSIVGGAQFTIGTLSEDCDRIYPIVQKLLEDYWVRKNDYNINKKNNINNNNNGQTSQLLAEQRNLLDEKGRLIARQDELIDRLERELQERTKPKARSSYNPRVKYSNYDLSDTDFCFKEFTREKCSAEHHALLDDKLNHLNYLAQSGLVKPNEYHTYRQRLFDACKCAVDNAKLGKLNI